MFVNCDCVEPVRNKSGLSVQILLFSSCHVKYVDIYFIFLRACLYVGLLVCFIVDGFRLFCFIVCVVLFFSRISVYVIDNT